MQIRKDEPLNASHQILTPAQHKQTMLTNIHLRSNEKTEALIRNLARLTDPVPSSPRP